MFYILQKFHMKPEKFIIDIRVKHQMTERNGFFIKFLEICNPAKIKALHMGKENYQKILALTY